jgi:hydroxyacylglutathione hydrolase
LIFERIKSEGLAHFSYLLGSDKEAVVIDPRRDCQIYLDIARREEIKIKSILETHRNEDYVIGSRELSNMTGAKIYHGPGLNFKYGETIQDGDTLTFGKMKIAAIYTPGHTDESMSYSLTDPASGDKAIFVFSGDALFVGDVGRTDLYGSEEAPRLAENLYNSIFNKILPLGDGVMLCPAHGGGSICGGEISDREWSTLGYERLQNPILKKTHEEFVKFKVAEHLERPPYFKRMEKYNLEGPPLLKKLPDPPPLSPLEFQKRIKQGALVLDARTPAAFGGAHIKESYSIWLEGIPSFAGWVLSYDKQILLILENREHLATVVSYLVRLGYDLLEGYLCGGVEACGLESWYADALPTEHLGLLTVQELRKRIDSGENLFVLDVRADKEWVTGHIEDSFNVYVGNLKERLDEIPANRNIAVICSVGNRASLGASILRRAGFREVYNVLGGVLSWQKANYPLVT